MNDPQAKIRDVAACYRDGQIEWLDGVSVTCPAWHFNLRASNTEPLLRLTLEAGSRMEMERRRDEVLGIVRAP